MVDYLIKKDQVEPGDGHQTLISSPSVKQRVESDKSLVTKQLSEYLGPLDESKVQIDEAGRVVIDDERFAAAAKAFQLADLPNLICNDHHLIC